MTANEPKDDTTEDGDEVEPGPDDTPVVLSAGDSDAPDFPDVDTVYPDKQGVPDK